MFSKRTNWERHPNALAELLAKLREKGEDILDLTESNPTKCGLGVDLRLLAALIDPGNLSYEPDPQGLLVARQAVSSYYAEKGISIQPEQVFLTASTSEAYTHLFRLLANPGDKILVPSVGYPLFGYLAGLNDVEVEHYGLAYDTAWHMDLSSLGFRDGAKELGTVLEEKRTVPGREPSPSGRLRAVILVNPNNPTGNFIHKRERRAVNDLCKAASCAIISDEVFFDYAYGENSDRVPSFAGNTEVLTFTLSGVSKVLGLPQMKLSWVVVAGPDELRREAIQRLEIIADTYLSVNTPSQTALPHWLETRSRVQKNILDRVLQNRAILEEAIKGHPKVRLLNAEGGWCAVLKVFSDHPDDELVLTLLEKDRVHVHPGYFFDLEKGTHLVLSLLPPSKDFEEGIRRLLAQIS